MKAKSVVIDTGALIKGVNIWEYGEDFCTVDEIILELRDRRAKEQLQAFPYEIKKLQPQQTYIKQINDVSKMTGDFASLSLNDIKVLALTLQLEVEAKGTSDHLEFNPKRAQTIFNGNGSGQTPVGFYFEKNKSQDAKTLEDGGSEGWRTPSDECDDNQCLAENSLAESEEEFYSTNDKSELSDNEDIPDLEDEMIEDNLKDEEIEAIMVEMNKNTINVEQLSDSKDDTESDDEGWITPSNISKNKKNKKNGSGFDDIQDPVEDVAVACMTSDFAMQNVLKHMKLQVMSPDGQLIRQLRSYILRCYACRSTTSIMSKIFCPKCGNKTLKRVSVTVNPDGTQHIWISTRRPINTKGTRFSLPTPKGGKHAAYPMLVEDQRYPDQRSSKKGSKKNNPLDPDYDAGDSPFLQTDIYSRAGQLGLVGGKQQGTHYWERRNPNVSVKTKGKKKK